MLTRTDVTYVGHNLKYDYIRASPAGITPGDTLFDTMIAAYLLDPSQPLKMDTIALKYLNYRPIPIESLIGSGRKQRSIADLPVQDVFTYACEDSRYNLPPSMKYSQNQLRTDELEQIARDVEFSRW